MVTFETWSRTINNAVCSSAIDHIYIKDPTKISSTYPITPPFGDHLIIIIETTIKKAPKTDLYRRNWRNYTPAKLNEAIRGTDWNIEFDSVQAYWNEFERKLIEITDYLAPWKKSQKTRFLRSSLQDTLKPKLIKETGS